MFHLKLCYPDLAGTGEAGGHCNEWLQSSNPALETTITGFKIISLAFPRNSINNPWAGLGRNLANDTKALMDDAPSEVDYYWSAIGMTFYHGQNDTIPGPLHHLVKKVDLYVDTGR